MLQVNIIYLILIKYAIASALTGMLTYADVCWRMLAYADACVC